jgi:hypothetical protein
MTNVTHAQPPNIVGTWNIEVSFGDGKQHSLRFEAHDDRKGTFLLQDLQAKVWGAAKPSEATWSRGQANAVTFSGAMEFPIGNVGRDAGKLMFEGKFETPDLITGDVEFSPLVGDRPSKLGTFKAVRAGG